MTYALNNMLIILKAGKHLTCDCSFLGPITICLPVSRLLPFNVLYLCIRSNYRLIPLLFTQSNTAFFWTSQETPTSSCLLICFTTALQLSHMIKSLFYSSYVLYNYSAFFFFFFLILDLSRLFQTKPSSFPPENL